MKRVFSASLLAILMLGSSGLGQTSDRVAAPRLSRERGFCDASFDVAITCDTPGATIHYTLDGSEPDGASGASPAGRIYTAPLRITGTTCLRAQATREGQPPSEVVTHTYVFLHDVIARSQKQVLAQGYPDTWYGGLPADYEMDPEVCFRPAYANLMQDALLSIPTVSLVTSRDAFFSHSRDPETGGVYIFTGHSSTGGIGWERPISFELFTADGSKRFQVNCGLRIQGDESRDPLKCPKHSFELRFDSPYGSNRLDYPLFDGSPVESFDSLRLQGFYQDSWLHWAVDQRRRALYMRDRWMRDSLLEMGQTDAGRGLCVHLYLNGIYWGLYNLGEQVDASHHARYQESHSAGLDVVEGDPAYGGPEPGRLIEGTTEAWLQLQNTVASRDWDRICDILDVDNFIDWSILNGFAATRDLRPNGHWRAVGGGPDQRLWRFYSQDAERTLESNNHDTVAPDPDPTGLFDCLDDIEEFRIRFGDRVQRHLSQGGVLTPRRNAERWVRLADEIELAIVAESARWGDYRRDVHPYEWGPYSLYTRDDHWIPAKNRVLDEYFPRRTETVLEQLTSRGLYPTVGAPTFLVDGVPQHGGIVAPGSILSLHSPSGVIWYTLDGTDPRRPAQGPQTVVHTLVSQEAPKRVLVPTHAISDAWKGGSSFSDSSWTLTEGLPGGVGYERSGGYEPLIGLDVHDPMYAKNRTCYVRIPFHLADDPAKFDHMTLRIRYDDAFVAYLNGVEIRRALFQGAPTWNSGAFGTHEGDDAEVFTVSGGLPLLRQGENILAIHGMNSATDSSDFLIWATLEVVESTAARASSPSATAIPYSGPTTIYQTIRIGARTLIDGNWSALTDAVFTIETD
ncbi:MAG TPA: FN3 associated domain-containing protein [Sedimentisphaerales bacterium]|nr:FN3 associated domain-containing protein [Sedimentisphaerales bacterium]